MSIEETEKCNYNTNKTKPFFLFYPLIELIVLSNCVLSDIMLDTVFAKLITWSLTSKVLPSSRKEDKQTQTAGQCDKGHNKDVQGHNGSKGGTAT